MGRNKHVYVCPECSEIACSKEHPLNPGEPITCMACEHQFQYADGIITYKEKKDAVPFDMKIVERICEIVATTETGIHHICRANQEFPHVSNFFRWLAKHAEARDMYARAREAQADLMAANIITIADDSSNDTKRIRKGEEVVEVENTEWTNRSKLRVDARKWAASKLAPKKYGDKLEVSGDPQSPLALQITGMQIT